MRRLIERTKIPVYTEMTKKKIVNQENCDGSPLRQSLKSSYRPRQALEEIDSNVDKNDGLSTCLNFGCHSRVQGGYVVTPSDESSRSALVL